MKPAAKALMPLDEAWSALRGTALEQVRQHAPGTEQVPSVDALGRVLAQALVSGVDVPPLDNSAMDGYAVRVADLVPAALPTDGQPVLPVSQRIAAGQVGQPLAPGTCARIFTGAPVPPGADAVVMQEHTQAEGLPVQQMPQGPKVQQVRFMQPVQPGQNIRRRGEDIAQGREVLRAGLRLSPAALGVAASVGAEHLAVVQRPRVGVLTTGSELVMPGQPLPAGSIYNSNRHTLHGLVQAAGAVAHDLGCVPDDLAVTRAALRAAAAQHDLVISSGGVSVGEEDHLRAAVLAEGSLDFWALAIKPGKPFVLGRLYRPDGSSCLYMGLPGNPVASFVTFLLLVRPVLGVLAGEGWHLPAPLRLPAGFDWPRADARREFLRARIDAQGQVVLHPHQGSGVLTSAAWAEGLVDLAPGQTVARGQPVAFVPVSQWLQPSATLCQG